MLSKLRSLWLQYRPDFLKPKTLRKSWDQEAHVRSFLARKHPELLDGYDGKGW